MEQLTVKSLTKALADYPDAVISVAVVNGIKLTVSPATQIQVMVTHEKLKPTANLIIVTHESGDTK